MIELIQQLKKDGIEKGLCCQYQRKFKTGISAEELCKMFIAGIDFCISENYPTLEFIRDNFKGLCEPYGIFIDDKVVDFDSPDIVLNGSCIANLQYSGYSVSRIYIRHDSKSVVNAIDNSIVTIDAFDNSKIRVNTFGNAKVLVNLYGNSDVKEFGQNIKVRRLNRPYY